MGIRAALGADRNDILKLALGTGLAMISTGVILGVASAWALTRTMAKLLIGVSGSDPVSYTTAVVVISAVALFACWTPARRATRVDPLVALRYE